MKLTKEETRLAINLIEAMRKDPPVKILKGSKGDREWKGFSFTGRTSEGRFHPIVFPPEGKIYEPFLEFIEKVIVLKKVTDCGHKEATIKRKEEKEEAVNATHASL